MAPSGDHWPDGHLSGPLDEDGDQEISGGELGKAHALITKYGNGMADLAHGGMMEGIDTNHDGKVDVDEWLAYMAAVEQTIGTREFVRSCKLCIDALNRSHVETGAVVPLPQLGLSVPAFSLSTVLQHEGMSLQHSWLVTHIGRMATLTSSMAHCRVS